MIKTILDSDYYENKQGNKKLNQYLQIEKHDTEIHAVSPFKFGSECIKCLIGLPPILGVPNT